MSQCRFHFFWRSPLGVGLAIAASLLPFQASALAQNITLDGTLGGTPDQAIPVTPGGTLGGFSAAYPNAYIIQETFGRRIGGNLFHSFGRFNLNKGESAVFLGTGLQNILARVTGGSVSAIDGLIQTQSTNVNLFLINPQGILFGPNAALDVGGSTTGRGSFIATTTDSLIWGNDPNRRFSATQPGGVDSLLTLVGDPSGFLNSQRRPGTITVTGSGDPTATGLTVLQDKRLLLLGGNVELNGGVLRAIGGRIELGAIAGAGTVGLDLNTSGVSLQIPDTIPRADIGLDRSFVITNSAAADGGDIAFQARNIELSNDTQLQAATFGAGDAGNVLLRASEAISLESGSTIFSTIETGGQGQGGNISILTPSLSMSGGAQLQTLVRQGGNGIPGVIFVNTNGGDISLSGDRTAMFSSLDEGATNSFSGGDFAGNVFGALLGQTNAKITGSVFISTGTLSLTDGAGLRSDTFGNGNAGAVIVLANDVSITNGGFISSIVGPKANGDGGGIVIGTDRLSIRGTDTGLTTSTLGNGDAGLIFAVASDRIEINGKGSGIFSTVESGSSGAGGGIVLSARSLTLDNEAAISVNNEGSGAAGAIFISALAIFLNRNSQISAVTQSGEGGNIELNVAILNLYNSSDISTNADTARLGSGIQPGGNIRITGLLRFGFDRTIAIAAKPGRNSNIVAKAFKGRGGDISIFAGRLLGIRQRSEVFATNDIDASSQFGANGVVSVNLIDIDPERGTVQLAENLADASQLIAEGCDTRGKLALGRFTNSGRGGLPPTPTDYLADDNVIASWVSVDQPVAQGSERSPMEPSSAVIPRSAAATEIIEAQGWKIDPDGNVVLIAQAAAATPQIPWLAPGTCRMPGL